MGFSINMSCYLKKRSVFLKEHIQNTDHFDKNMKNASWINVIWFNCALENIHGFRGSLIQKRFRDKLSPWLEELHKRESKICLVWAQSLARCMMNRVSATLVLNVHRWKCMIPKHRGTLKAHESWVQLQTGCIWCWGALERHGCTTQWMVRSGISTIISDCHLLSIRLSIFSTLVQ